MDTENTHPEGLSPEQAHLVRTGFARGSQLEMSLACSGVPKMDVLSNSDPFCVVYSRSSGKEWESLGSTETIIDSHTCSWTKKFYISSQRICAEFRFEVYDRDSPREKLKDHDFIGYVEGKHVMSILESKKSTAKYQILRSGAKGSYGVLTATLDWIEKPIANYDLIFEVQIKYSVRAKLYYQVMRRVPCDNQYVLVHRSGLLGKDDSQFEQGKIKLSLLSAGSITRMFRIEILQFCSMGKSKVLGFIRTNVEELSKAEPTKILPWIACHNGFDEANVWVTPRIEKGRKIFQISIT